jgi:hypothetical protein
MAEEAVIAHLKLSNLGFGTPAERQQLMSLEPRLEQTIRDAHAGVFDGNEFGGGECVFYMYGPDAEVLYRAVEPIIRAAAPRTSSFVVKRRGAPDDPDAKEETIQL